MKKILQVVPDVSEEANGVAPVIFGLSAKVMNLDNKVDLACLGVKHHPVGVGLYVSKKWPILKRFEISIELARYVKSAANQYDIIHNHSLWSMINVVCGIVVPGKKAKLVTSPHGTLSPWAMSHSKHIKQMLWPLQKLVLAKADLIHATSEEELHDIRRLGFTSPVAVIPNGIEVPEKSDQSITQREKTLLFLGRLHPIKGIDRLLTAWSEIQSEFPDWKLVIAGKGDAGYKNKLENLARQLDVDRVFFTGPVYGAQKSEAYSKASIFILPTHSENFGMVVAEALAHGCPAIVGRGAPWSGIIEKKCGWWIDNDVTTMTVTLKKALQMDTASLASMGLAGRRWMEEEYSWSAIGKKMDCAYRWLVEGGEPPEWVKVGM